VLLLVLCKAFKLITFRSYSQRDALSCKCRHECKLCNHADFLFRVSGITPACRHDLHRVEEYSVPSNIHIYDI
jgi:hypothetical protein